MHDARQTIKRGACRLHPSVYASSATPRLGDGFVRNQAVRRCEMSRSWRTKTFRPYDSKRVLAEAAMSRKLVWIERPLFRGFGCSECGWRFKPADALTDTSFDDMMRNFELQRDKEFTSHVCADHSKEG
jgi:hypothetical protein